MSALANNNPIHVDAGIPGAGLARTQTRGTQALSVMQPRDIRIVEKKAMEEALMLGELALYGWGAGKDRVEGPSWPLSKSLMRIYGNCSLDMEPVQDLPDAWVFTARAVDHETGFSISRQFRQSKQWTVHGKFDAARKEDIRFQIGQSKALRNVAFAFLPEWLIERALDTAKGGIRETLEKAVAERGMEKVVASVAARALRVGVTEKRLLTAMDRTVLAAITIEDLVIIAGGIKALETGTDTIDNVFPVPEDKAGAGGSNTDRINDVLGLGASNKAAETSQHPPNAAGASAPASTEQPQTPAPAGTTPPPLPPDGPALDTADAQTKPSKTKKSKGDADAQPPAGWTPDGKPLA